MILSCIHRPYHLKRNIEVQKEYKNFSSLIGKYKKALGEQPLILCQDEARVGRIGGVRKSWESAGERPVC